MTNSDWFSLTPEQIKAAIDARPEHWTPVGKFRGCMFSHYEASDKGSARSLDRVIAGRRYDGTVLSLHPNNSGYPQVDLRCDNPAHKKHTVTMHSLVVAKFRPGGIPDGMECRHGPAGQLVNAWPENLDVGSHAQNWQDSKPAGAPTFPCRNAPTCGNMVINEGRRCIDCIAEVGRQAAALLEAGMNLQDVAEVFGYSGPDWVFKLAVQHGGYAGSKADARMQHPGLQQRAMIRLRFRRLLRSGEVP